MTWKTHRQLLDLLITSAANGGNLILNVGPTARGEFDYRAKNALDSLAYWMHANSKAIYGCTYAPDDYKTPEGTKLTYSPRTKRLYVLLYDYPSDGKLVLPGYSGKVRYAQLLNDDSEVRIEPGGNSADITLRLPLQKPKYEIPVVELIVGQ
jgi:alpha-L-fucosidase